MCIRKLFGTDGIRGVANEYPLTIEMCLKLAKAIALTFCDSGEKRSIIIGKDTRISCDMFEHALAAALCSFGVNVRLLGITPTPAISILTRQLNADVGIMISASHNPFYDNGIKIFNDLGLKLKDNEEAELEKIMMNDSVFSKTRINFGKVSLDEHALDIYCDAVKKSFRFKRSDVENLKIVLDSANGAFSFIASPLLREFGFDVISLCDSPNGININDGCGVSNPETLARAVIEHEADVGIAFDGDGDRVLLADEKGNLIDGDHVLAILAQSGDFGHPEIVSTIMSNLAFEKYLASRKIKLVRTDVGDRYISEYMQKSDATLGGEPSGHIIIKSHAPTGDGLFAGLKVIECLVKSRKKLSELSNIFEPYPSISKNVQVKDKSIVHSSKVKEEIEKFEKKLNNRGRLIIRPSGTEPVVRIYAEGENIQELEESMDALQNAIGERLAKL